MNPSLGSVTCDNARQSLAGWGYERVVTTGWRRVVTTLFAQIKLPTIGANTESRTGAGANDEETDEDLQPCGRRLAGDEAGLSARVSEQGRCVNEHQPG